MDAEDVAVELRCALGFIGLDFEVDAAVIRKGRRKLKFHCLCEIFDGEVYENLIDHREGVYPRSGKRSIKMCRISRSMHLFS